MTYYCTAVQERWQCQLEWMAQLRRVFNQSTIHGNPLQQFIWCEVIIVIMTSPNQSYFSASDIIHKPWACRNKHNHSDLSRLRGNFLGIAEMPVKCCFVWTLTCIGGNPGHWSLMVSTWADLRFLLSQWQEHIDRLIYTFTENSTPNRPSGYFNLIDLFFISIDSYLVSYLYSYSYS